MVIAVASIFLGTRVFPSAGGIISRYRQLTKTKSKPVLCFNYFRNPSWVWGCWKLVSWCYNNPVLLNGFSIPFRIGKTPCKTMSPSENIDRGNCIQPRVRGKNKLILLNGLVWVPRHTEASSIFCATLLRFEIIFPTWPRRRHQSIVL